ncbi:MAG: hypothetical protein NVS3B10_29520 [Polyangiales bacterium]
MKADALQRAWVAQAQADADRGVIACRMCRQHGPLEEALTLWRDGTLLFAVCEGCARSNDVSMRATDSGVEIRGRSRSALILASRT